MVHSANLENMLLYILYIFTAEWFILCAAQMICPIPWWYCLNRDPGDNSQVTAVDTSNRSIKWTWDSGGGRWDVSYRHSFPSGKFAVYSSFIQFGDNSPSYVMYDSDSTWRSNAKAIQTTAWEMAYNGDAFGFEPGSNGQYTFHIYSRKIKYNPFLTVATSPIPITQPTPPQNRCPTIAEERAQGTFWWLDRKSSGKCPVTVSTSNQISPVDWEWQTNLGRWRVSYSWSGGVTNCSVYYIREISWSQSVQIVGWSFSSQQLVVTYTSVALRIAGEQEWKLQVNGGETFGYTPLNVDEWFFPIYSRNVIVRPFQRTSGVFTLF